MFDLLSCNNVFLDQSNPTDSVHLIQAKLNRSNVTKTVQ